MSSVANLKKKVENLSKKEKKLEKKVRKVKKEEKRFLNGGDRRKRVNPRKGVIVRNRRQRPGLDISYDTQRFLDCMSNPFGTRGAKVPDYYYGETVLVKDFYRRQIPVIYGSTSETGGSLVATPGSATAFMLFMIPGEYDDNTYYNVTYSNTNGTTDDYKYWHVGMVPIGTNGDIAYSIDGQPYYAILNTANLVEIFAANNENSLLSSARITAMGVRVTPTIEVVTDSNQPYISSIQAALVPSVSFFDIIMSQKTAPNTVISGLPSSKSFSNEEGCSMRVNVVQSNSMPILSMKTQDTWDTALNFLDGKVDIPVMLITLSEAITGTIQNPGVGTRTQWNGTVPFYVEVEMFLEGEPQYPSPLIGSWSPIDVHFREVAAMASLPGAFDCITKGHSFKNFSKNAGKFARKVGNIMMASSRIAERVGRTTKKFADVFEDDK